MDYQPLGDSGLVVSMVGIGCNAFGTRIDQDTVDDIVDAALDAGVNFFDTADTYGRGLSEEMLGRALQGRRQDVVVATKFGMDMDGANGPDHGARASRRYVRRAVEASLRRLQTDHIDLYQLHQPDLVTPMEETLSALGELVVEGKVRYIGCSNFAAWEVADAHHVARQLGVPGYISAQNEYSLYNRVAEDELLPACRALGLSVLPYFPLAYGLLTGKYERGEDAPTGSRLSAEGQRRRLQNADFDRIDALQAFADSRAIDLLTLAVSGLLAQAGVGSVIAGVSRPDQVARNVGAASWRPARSDLEELAGLNRDPLPGMSHRTYARRG
ncbi:aldo/keto reductase [Nocardioides marmoribigeumensis]|uniref:Aryl-alcohol dehydrogenase-like predicted oxidoreductase n=1 Tax=Nocardioides marmoribigeumensis TaxID=433649 RepID=A0ABU2C0H5_9ACTN|nr:aldo/keto reductase [Nocardioides marmoribigeumensis]MDR7364151.1 aryl-alcohol dehydrogenase-like predicted oxidoreductase [Nocardioides marmoribigeumensis]